MAPLAVDPQALDGAGATVVSAGEGLGSVVSTLTTALAGCNGMAGDDPAGAAFGRTYNRSASKLLEAMTTTRNGLCGLGDGVRMSAHNYSVAEAMSNVSGHGEPLPAPHPDRPYFGGLDTVGGWERYQRPGRLGLGRQVHRDDLAERRFGEVAGCSGGLD